MKRPWILLLALAACSKEPEPASAAAVAAPRPVRVLAASSLKELVTEVADAWSKQSGGTTQLQFDSTSTLARQIAEGAPADLFLTAAPEWLDEVTTIERADWLSNRLVLVVPTDAPGVELAALQSLSMANEQVPAGKYARAALASLKVTPPDRVILGESVRDVLSKVSEGGAQAGIVYATDAAVDPKVRVAFTFPAASHPKIVYSVGVLTPAGKSLGAALREQRALDVARKLGFEVP